MRMIRWMCGVTELDRIRHERIKGTRQRKCEKSQRMSRKKVEVVLAFDAKIVVRREGDVNGSTREEEEESLREDGWTK